MILFCNYGIPNVFLGNEILLVEREIFVLKLAKISKPFDLRLQTF